MRRFLRLAAAGAAATTLLTACADSSGTTGTSGVSLTAVTPAPQATAVPTGSALTLMFGQAMMPGMEQYLDLHQGTLAGPTVPMGCGWNGGRTTLTCVPAESLMSATHYTIHVGAGMTDAQGDRIDMSDWTTMGGRWATNGTGMRGGTHAGEPMGTMGPGWTDGAGHYGMTFGFTTK